MISWKIYKVSPTRYNSFIKYDKSVFNISFMAKTGPHSRIDHKILEHDEELKSFIDKMLDIIKQREELSKKFSEFYNWSFKKQQI